MHSLFSEHTTTISGLHGAGNVAACVRLLRPPSPFRIENEAPASASARSEESSEPSTSAPDLGPLASSPLSELLTVALPADAQVSAQARDILLLLKALESLNR